MVFYNTNGIITDEAPSNDFWISEINNQFILKEGDITSDLDFKLIALNYKVADKLFGGVDQLYRILASKPIWLSQAGVDTELGIPKHDFEKLINSSKTEETHKILYYYDVQNLIGSLQNLIQESKFLFCDFFKTLNINSFMLGEIPFNPNSTMFASGSIVTNVFSKINHLFINLASQLDFLTKIAIEFENTPSDFSEYPKMRAKNILYGDAKQIKLLQFDDTLFEKTDNIKLIINLRNEIVHNASFQNIPKIYQVFKDNKLIEKFILIPDTTNGNIDNYKNRNRFFSQELKLNILFPNLIVEFWNKMQKTIDAIK